MVAGVAQPTGKPAEQRPQALPSGEATAPAPDPTLSGDDLGRTAFSHMSAQGQPAAILMKVRRSRRMIRAAVCSNR
jgi:hypothetical protein